MEAPEKIYYDGENRAYKLPVFSSCNIEYIRSDAFIEKVEEYLQEHLIDYWSQSVTDESKFIEDFKDYMKGE